VRRVLVLVEGQTEERFIKVVLAPHLSGVGIVATPKILVTKRVKGVQHFKGGVSSYAQVKGDLRRLLGDTGAAAVTTMLDLYGLPGDFPGKATLPHARIDPAQRAAILESALASDLDDGRLIPYLSLHEFEALLFSNPEVFDRAFPADLPSDQIRRVREGFPTPEDINEGSTTHPAARLATIVPRYDKAVFGPLLADQTGLSRMRAECPHFNEWVSKLERLAA
jgi:hypothetical protein